MKRFLLDTHAFLWWVTDDERLSQDARDIISSASSEILFSVVSAWEIAIKTRLGRLQKVGDPEQVIPRHVNRNNFTVLQLNLGAALKIHSLPDYHQDLFDRVLISQGLCEDIPIISKDKHFESYGVQIIW